MSKSRERIRNFSIIAHIDHGKSTLSDRLIQTCGGLSEREMSDQVLDSMELERERGITIKAQSVTLNYKANDGQDYQFNFIDTPGHVDFSYEVSRSLAACEGALLVVDAAQGVEAQSVANCYAAIEQGLEIILVLNKVDLPQADPEAVAEQVEAMIGLPADSALLVSAKTGKGVDALLERIVSDIPPPTGDSDKQLQALIVDSWFDKYQGIVSLVRIFQGKVRSKERILVKSTNASYIADKIGYFTPKQKDQEILAAGEVGYIIAGIKDIYGAPVGDTITHEKTSDVERLPGFQTIKPRVFAGIFPVESEDFEHLREALDKLKLNDAALFFEPETSGAMGYGFRCGFLGMLHMEIIQERLEREYDLSLIASVPTVVYKVITKSGDTIFVDNPARWPAADKIETMLEPVAEVNIIVPEDYLGAVLELCSTRRGVQNNMQFSSNQVSLTYSLPMNEVVVDFFDRIKSVSKGFASVEYEFASFEEADLSRLDVLINGECVDALALLVHRDQARNRGKQLVDKMKELIPRQMFDIAIQAAIGSQIVARSTVKALRKNVTAKCYGGDITRKKKLLEKQKRGKKRMKQIGRVEVPKEAFLAAMKVDD